MLAATADNTMVKRTKITLALLILVMAIGALVVGGLYTVEIEDYYGDNQNVFYKCRQGDIAVNRDTQEIRIIEKSWRRIYSIQDSDTIDLWLWLHENRIEIYRPKIKRSIDETTGYKDVENLAAAGKIELVIRNR